MTLFLDTLFLLMLVIALHVSSMAGCAKAFGVTVRRIVCGYGPAVFQSSLFQFRMIPWGGYVKLKDSRDEALDAQDRKDAFDQQPALIHSFVLYLPAHSSLAALGLLCAKVAAFNALPIPTLNGGQALMALASVRGASHTRLQQAGILAGLAIYGSWLTALAYYLWRAAA